MSKAFYQRSLDIGNNLDKYGNARADKERVIYRNIIGVTCMQLASPVI